MEIQCPNCGGYGATFNEENVNRVQKLFFLLTFGLYDPWEGKKNNSKENFLGGKKEACCEICGYRFNVSEKIDLERIYNNRDIRMAGEKRLAAFMEKEKEKMKNYPEF